MNILTTALQEESSANELKSHENVIHKKKISFLSYRVGEVCIPKVSGTYEFSEWRIFHSLLSMKSSHGNPNWSWFGVHIGFVWQGFDSRKATDMAPVRSC